MIDQNCFNGKAALTVQQGNLDEMVQLWFREEPDWQSSEQFHASMYSNRLTIKWCWHGLIV